MQALQQQPWFSNTEEKPKNAKTTGNWSWSTSVPPGMNLFFSHPNIWAWNSAKQRASPRAGKVCQQGLLARLASNMNTTFQWSPRTAIFPTFSPGYTHANQCSKSGPCTELFCSTSLCFRACWDASVMFSFYKTTQVEEIGTSIHVPQSSTFLLEHCSLLLQAKWGRVSVAETRPCYIVVLSLASCGQSWIVLVLIHICQE